MEALTLQNSALAPRSSANKSRACASTSRIDIRRTYFGFPLGHQAPLQRIVRPCGSFSNESAAAAAPAANQPGLSSLYEEGMDLDESIALLKKAAKTRKVPATEVLNALCALERAKLDPSLFLATIGGSTEAPGPRTWMLIFTSNKEQVSESFKGGSGTGSYFPITAVQKFDATAMTIENGAYLGRLGSITFQGRMSWKNRILAFLFDSISIKIGSLGPFKLNIARKEDVNRVPTSKDPFFVWHYADEEIIVARGRGGGLAFWCRCERVNS